MIRAVFLIINSRPDSHWISFMKSQLKHYDLRNSAEPLGPEQSPTNHLCCSIYFPAILRCYRPLKLTQRLISFALDLLAFNVTFTGTFIPPPIHQRPLASPFWKKVWKIMLKINSHFRKTNSHFRKTNSHFRKTNSHFCETNSHFRKSTLGNKKNYLSFFNKWMSLWGFRR